MGCEKRMTAGAMFDQGLQLTGSLFANVWAFLMLTVFPLYAPNQYFDLGDHKFRFFLWVSVICLLPAAAIFLIRGIRKLRGNLQETLPLDASHRHGFRRILSPMDIAVLCYLAAVLLSFACSDYKKEAWTGAEGWYMGLRTQLLMITAYFCLSRCILAKKILLTGHFFGSGAACLLGILHRFRIDPLGMYDGISEKYYLEFLSTLGQATWFSSYLCTVLAVGVAYFFMVKKGWFRICSGLYCMLGFTAVVTQNSDSAFLAMGALFLGLFCAACRRMEWMERFFETLLLMLGSFKIIGILQLRFADQAIRLDGISVFLSQSTATWLLLAAVSLAYMLFLMYRMKHPEQEMIRAGRWMPWAAAGGLALAVSGYVLAVWLNTTGRLIQQSGHSYLLFDDVWGSYRGLIWKASLALWEKMGFFRKFVGVGPDCFQNWCYADVSVSSAVSRVFGASQVLTNAHNELLNVLICLGGVGLAAFLALFVTAVKGYLSSFAGVNDSAVKEPLVLAGGLAALCYFAHNFFCYQQTCCTPFLFLLLAAAENRRQGMQRTRQL